MRSLGERGQERDSRVRRQLERILESELFARSDQLSRFLRFIVERHLEGRNEELKESVIGVEVFGRKPDYNPKFDPIVRTEARRLRARLGDYYTNGGKRDPLVIGLPKGGYVPMVTEAPGEIYTGNTNPTGTGVSVGEISVSARRARLAVIIASVCLAIVLAAAGRWWEIQHRNTPIAVAVMPLTNLSQDPANDYFSD